MSGSEHSDSGEGEGNAICWSSVRLTRVQYARSTSPVRQTRAKTYHTYYPQVTTNRADARTEDVARIQPDHATITLPFRQPPQQIQVLGAA